MSGDRPDTRWLIVGAGGMLGRELARALETRPATLLGRDELDIRDARAVGDAVVGADIVVNAAAYTRVDDAEDDEATAMAVNATGAGNLARAVALSSARMVHVSTDYVFDGRTSAPYPESAPLDPLGAYGRTKAEGERQVSRALPHSAWIVRTAWLYGGDGQGFPRTMLRLSEQRDVSVVDDQVGQPTWAADVARKIVELVDADAPAGIYHATSSGSTSWFEFAQAVLEEAGRDPARIHATTSAAHARRAPRPAWSVLGHEAWRQVGISPIGDWRDRLHEARLEGALDG